MKTQSEKYTPASKFIPGTNLYTTVERWEIVGRRVYVTFNDGLIMKSEETPGTLRAKHRTGEIVRL